MLLTSYQAQLHPPPQFGIIPASILEVSEEKDSASKNENDLGLSEQKDSEHKKGNALELSKAIDSGINKEKVSGFNKENTPIVAVNVSISLILLHCWDEQLTYSAA